MALDVFICILTQYKHKTIILPYITCLTFVTDNITGALTVNGALRMLRGPRILWTANWLPHYITSHSFQPTVNVVPYYWLPGAFALYSNSQHVTAPAWKSQALRYMVYMQQRNKEHGEKVLRYLSFLYILSGKWEISATIDEDHQKAWKTIA